MACTRWSVPGAVVGLERSGVRTVLTAGVLAVDGAEPVARETPFHLGSIAKSLAALIVVDAARRGELALDVPCSAQAAGTWDDTPLALMAQTTGRPNLLPDADEELAAFVSRVGEMPRVHPPGRFSYCNAGWSVLDLLLQRCSGGSFEELAEDRWLGDHATFGAPPDGAAGHAVGPVGEPARVPPDLAAAASAAGARWWASADGVLDYASSHLRGGTSRSALDADDIARLRDRRIRIPGSTVADWWGLGWATWDRGAHRSFGWSGYTAGHRAFLRCFPEQDASIVVLTNSAGPLFRAPGGSALFDDLLPALLAAVELPPLRDADHGVDAEPVERLAGAYGPVALEPAGGDRLLMHAQAFGEPEPILVERLGGNTFAPPGLPPGSMAIAVDDDLLYLGPFALPRG